MVGGSAKMFEAKVSGIRISIEVPMTAFGDRITRPSAVKIQLIANANTSSSPTPRSTPTIPPPARNPRTNPSPSVIVDAIE